MQLKVGAFQNDLKISLFLFRLSHVRYPSLRLYVFRPVRRIKCNCNKTSSQRSLDDEEATSTGSGATAASAAIPPMALPAEEAGQLVKQSCHDSGIDIRDPAAATAGAVPPPVVPVVAPIAAKKVYSDADIVLSADWVPPLTIAPTHCTESSPRNSSTASSQHSSLSHIQTDGGGSGRKKTSSVSFSVDEHDVQQHGGVSALDKGGETKKNKVSRIDHSKITGWPLGWGRQI